MNIIKLSETDGLKHVEKSGTTNYYVSQNCGGDYNVLLQDQVKFVLQPLKTPWAIVKIKNENCNLLTPSTEAEHFALKELKKYEDTGIKIPDPESYDNSIDLIAMSFIGEPYSMSSETYRLFESNAQMIGHNLGRFCSKVYIEKKHAHRALTPENILYMGNRTVGLGDVTNFTRHATINDMLAPLVIQNYKTALAFATTFSTMTGRKFNIKTVIANAETLIETKPKYMRSSNQNEVGQFTLRALHNRACFLEALDA